MSEEETPLVALEKDALDYKKEVEDNLKLYAKITLRSNNNDKAAYKNALEDAITQLGEYKEEGSQMVQDANELKRDDEPLMIKQKEFQKRQTAEVKKLKDILSKIDKQNKKLNQDLDKQIKLDDKEEKRDASVTKKSDEIETIEDSKVNKNDISGESNESKVVSNNDGKSDDKISNNSEPKGLKELMLEENRKADERKKEDLAKPVVLSKKEKEKLKKEEKKQKEEEKKQKRLEEKRLKEEKKKKPNEVPADLKGMMAMAFDKRKQPESEEKNEFSNSETDDEKPEDLSDTESVSGDSPPTKNLKNMYKEIKKIEGEVDEENDQKPTANLGKIYKDIKKIEGESNPGVNLIKSQELVGIAKEVRDIDENRFSDDNGEKFQHNSRSRVKKLSPNKLSNNDDDDEIDSENEEYDDDVYEDEEKDLKEVSRSKVVAIPTASDEAEFMEGQKLIVTKQIIPEYEGDLEVKKNDVVEFLDFSEEDVEWLEVRDKDGEIGFIPRSHVEPYNEPKDSTDTKQPKPKSKSKWKSFRGSLTAEITGKKSLLESGALKNTGAVPSSFADAILPSLIDQYNYEDALKVKLTESNLNFKNFYWESKENKIRNKLVQFQKLFLIHKCTHIPTPNKEEVTVLSRTLRICLFDGVSILSNIHTIRAHIIGRDEKTWSFEDDLSDNVSISDFSEFFIRSNLQNDNLNLSILFELSIYCRINSTNEESDLCCGWSSLPLIDPVTKQHLANKSYDLILNGGSIFGSKIPLDPKTRRNSGSNFNDLISKMFKESKIKLNVKEPANVFFDTLNCLPEPIIGSTVTAPFIKYYREELGLELLAPMIEIGSFDASTEPIQSNFLSSFSMALRQPDILDAARFEFTLLKENMKRDERNDNTKLRHNFIRAYEEIAYPLLYHSQMPMFDLKNHEDLEARGLVIAKIAKLVKKQKLLEFLLDGQEEFVPFSIDEIRYELLS